ncbi:SRPBCC domain-containing protein [Paraliomyxa miuraensis]|uniref:SRPBCC domain-containing protein n=1 Tax=Paraliomyxa miuraensis TaxID=376150 RepID=UPI0022531938|nr:SRPBCC domain-containing protein [Paraliomyxa miuraensis]MCX4247972.1 SRPBCC domain-containing protein [Paraliomyxa miuraensis]
MNDGVQPRPGDQAKVSVRVAVPRPEAWRIFTEEIDQWWRRGLKYRVAGSRRGIVHLEPGLGGRLFESFETKQGTEKVVQTGEVIGWEPPERLLLRWRNVNFKKDESTEVEVHMADAAGGSATLVTVIHRGWSEIRPDHPARHELPVPAFVRMMGLWWGELMTSLRMHAERSE